jgi:AcrR family transcriptional regulator
MTIKKTDRDQLIENTSYLLRVKGYHNTSISDIARACNLSKGSVYHYITSKKELAITVINQLHDHFKEHFFSLAYQEHLSSKERLVAFVKGTETFFIGRDGGCLMSIPFPSLLNYFATISLIG